VLEARREEFVRLFWEFAQTYPQTPEGQNHLIFYKSGREQGRRNFEELVAAEHEEEVADRVLLKLIPYKDSPGYREKGAWIHIAPATGDPRARTKAAMPDDWKKSAEAILRLVRRCNEHPDQLAKACREFSESPYSKGFQAGLITPILNAIRPDEFLLANGKSITVINHFSGTSFGPRLVGYPELNSTGHALIAEVAGEMRELGVADIQDADLFDMFSHWLVGVKKYFDKDESESLPRQAVLSWLENLQTRPSPDGQFHYKPLLLLALLDVLEGAPEHSNSFTYEELLAAFEGLATERGATVTENQFSQTYVRMKNDDTPLRVWIPQVVGTVQLEHSKADQPAYVRSTAPSVRIADQAWPIFASSEGREAIRRELEARWPSGRRYWWVNQGTTYRQELDGEYLWAPKESKGGRLLSHHTDLLRVRTGDAVFHYANGALRAVSEALEPAEEAPRPSELPMEPWNTEGHLLRTRYHELSSPLPLQDIPEEARVAEGGPFTRQGSVKQGYLFSLSSAFVGRLLADFPGRWPDFLTPPTRQHNVWLFQANPRYFNLEQELESVHPGDEDDWTVTRYREDMRAGDTVLLWQGGKSAGIYALGELTAEPHLHSYEGGELPAWLAGKTAGPDGRVTEGRVPFRYTRVLGAPVQKSTLTEHPNLRNMQVLRSPMGTNFKVSTEEWELLQELIRNVGTEGLDRGPLNLILYGPPGTGKTYSVQRRALQIIDPRAVNSPDANIGEMYRRYMSQGRIEFLTFHPSYSYEEFVEGYRYDVEAQVPMLHDGVFKTLVNRAVNPRQGPAVAEGARIWKVSLGRPSQPQILERCIANNEIGVGWLGDQDLIDSDREAIKELFGEHEGGDKATNNINSVDYLVNEIREGDYVAVFRSRREIQAIGVVTGEYQYKGEGHDGFPHTRPVEWLDRRVHDIYEMNGSTNLTRTTVYPLDRISLQDFVELLPEHQKTEEPYVLVIDEINRGNISRIFGELITLLEPDKRRGAPNELSVRLPYSQQHFAIPSNLYVIGTMNTADRSIALIDVALRRRFEFEEMMPNVGVIREILSDKAGENADTQLSADQVDLVCHAFEVLNRRITVRLDRDHQIGHSYFLDATSMARLHQALYGRVFPLLQEYFYNDWESLRLVLGEYDGGANRGFVASLEGEYDHVFGEDAPSYETPSAFHQYDPDELEEVLRNTFGSP
jgi:5-methylcytosine-specific restriction protein B